MANFFTKKNSPKEERNKDSDILHHPAMVHGLGNEHSGHIKIDQALCNDQKVLIVGWSTHTNPVFQVKSDACITIQRQYARPDVAEHLGLPDKMDCGFVLLIDNPEQTSSLQLGVTPTDDAPFTFFNIPLERIATDAFERLTIEYRVFKPDARFHHPEAPHFATLITHLPDGHGHCRYAMGYFEAAVCCESTGDTAVVGWLAQAPDTTVWLEDENGNRFSLNNAFRLDRSDVRAAISSQVSYPVVDSGFCCHLSGLKPGQRLKLKVLSHEGVWPLADIICQPLSSDPIEAARWLASIATPINMLHQRMAKVDGPLLSNLLSKRQEQWSSLPVTLCSVGTQPDIPKVSVIIPLYGRTDFVEHQLMEFAKDPWFLRNAELIYVLDDPTLVGPFAAEAEALYRVYGVPFKWVWGSINRGFSGANNLGVAHSRGEYLLFLNSDAFPRQTGWAESMMQELKRNPKLGAIAPRLLFADGGIQHAGMTFLRREELGIWINHHPNMGLDPMFDPNKKLTTLPAVTGACLMVRKRDLEAVNGWDTGYLIGDFEDSDLCLKLRAKGFNIGYLPTVELTHLERQSFKLLGQDDFRTRVVILNATRHQSRWHAMLEAKASTQRMVSPLAKVS